jgi:phosphatidylinositol phospholipase C delta
LYKRGNGHLLFFFNISLKIALSQMHSLLLRLALSTVFLLSVPKTYAAHIQFQDCKDHQPLSSPITSKDRFVPNTLRAYLEQQQDETHLSFEILANFPTLAACERSLLDNASAELSLGAVGGTRRYNSDHQNATCETKEFKQINKVVYLQVLDVLFKIDDPAPLAAYEVEINIDGPDHFSAACLKSFLTPDIGSTFQGLSFWGPALTFVLVILVAGWREWYNLVHPLNDDDESGPERGSDRSHLTRIADCLTYIQFIFFSSALSLNQPGFLQPVVTGISWSTLMLRKGIVWRESRYYGIHDGIHEINGTFGGTSGLEHMTQVMAAPVTVDTWTNIISLALVILFGLYGILQIGLHLRWTRDWFNRGGTWSLESSTLERQKATIWVALRVFLSYLLFPLTAWTTYQLDSATARPIYYVFLVIVVVALLIIASWWGLASRSPQNMGYLLIDDIHKQDTNEDPSRTQDYYTLVTFILLFARGVIVGGLQRFGTAQVCSLIACELIQLCFLAWVKAAPGLLSKPFLMAGARLTVLLLCLGMIPHLWSHTAASALGYILLVFHTIFLIGMFLVPSALEFGRLSATSYYEWKTAPPLESSRERPQVCNVVLFESNSCINLGSQVYGLRQLRRRPTNRTNLSERGIIDYRSSLSSSEHSSSNSSNTSNRDSGPMSPELSRTYFRSPRPERSVSSLSDRNQQFPSFEIARPKRSISNHSERNPRPTSSLSNRSRQFPSLDAGRPETVYENPNERTSEGSSRSEASGDPADAPSPWEMVLPLATDVDYSVREIDRYYVKPRRVSFGNANNDIDGAAGQASRWANKLKFWS